MSFQPSPGLTLDERFARFALGVQGVEVLFEALFRDFSGCRSRSVGLWI